ncbi:uncharacterized protein BO72DRAFT_80173 [Aspergillus fijiensis CBS 313.89]|uniref:Tat pathway signal sequence n=1 Tax=Aspergillus fijiensis CBS 313.89 TaxID=1448319 RepID=A0A8G1RUW3_9EURO|nr:uncharacterized protein BO72DRAFT_80173 [Aspergillus fijiensis CBS 313.89]RAK78295.1 hypothetical protein BO72DRAFT_80173 [Aspergillus fijiensis CBS 313.89]
MSLQPEDVALVNNLAKIHYMVEQPFRNGNFRAGHKAASPGPDLDIKWKDEPPHIQALYTARASELASSDQYKGAQVNDHEFANTLYAKLYAGLDSNQVAAAFPIQLFAFISAVKMLLSPDDVSGSRSAQGEKAGATENLLSQKEHNATNADQEIQALEAAVKKGVKVLTSLSQLFGEPDNWKSEPDWPNKIKRTQDKARKETVVIGVAGSTGAGKSSLVNALIDDKDILTTDCMRASTAVPVEVHYNKGQSRYRAEVVFIERKGWERELNTLFAELRGYLEDLARGEEPKDAEATIALQKIMAVYPALERQALFETSPSELVKDERVSDLLAQTVRFEDNDSKRFADNLKLFIDSKVRVVRVYVKAKALSTGAVLVDLPGVSDSNAARVAVADDYMKRCSAHWIVAPINRAVNDKIAHDLLGKNFKIQMHMNNAFNDITFVCTKTDDLVPAEVLQSLGLELPPIDGLEEFSDRLDAPKIKTREFRDRREQIRTELEPIEDEIDDLEERLRGEDINLDAALLTPQKRKKTRIHDDSAQDALLRLSDDAGMEYSDSDDAEDDVHELLRHLQSLRAQRKKLQSQRRDTDRKIAKYQKHELDDLRFCIAARNKFAKEQIKHDFSQTIAGLDQEDEQHDDIYLPTMARDYSEFERNLSVYCVSTKAYQELRGHSRRGNRLPGFSDLEQTEVPALQQYSIALTRKSREKTARRFLVALNSLLQSLTLWSAPITTAARTSAQKRQQMEAEFRSAVDDLTEAMKRPRAVFVASSRATIQSQIIANLDQAWRHGCDEFSQTVGCWNAPHQQEGFRWNRYQAFCRRQGVHDNRNLNEEIAQPMIAKIKPGWRSASDQLPDAYKQLREEFEKVVSRFHSESMRWITWDSPRTTRARLQRRLVALHESIKQGLEDLQAWTDREKRDKRGCFRASIATGLQATYQACAQYTGRGVLKAIRTTMSEHAEKQGPSLFCNAADQVSQVLEEWLCELDTKLEKLVKELLQEVAQDYHRALIAPHLQHRADEHTGLKAQIRDLLRDAEADLQLDRLLGEDGPLQHEQAPPMDQQEPAATGTTADSAAT